MNRKFYSNPGKLRSELALFESAATRYTCQMRSAPAMSRTRNVGSTACARYRYGISLLQEGMNVVSRGPLVEFILEKLSFIPKSFISLATEISENKQHIPASLKHIAGMVFGQPTSCVCVVVPSCTC